MEANSSTGYLRRRDSLNERLAVSLNRYTSVCSFVRLFVRLFVGYCELIVTTHCQSHVCDCVKV